MYVVPPFPSFLFLSLFFPPLLTPTKPTLYTFTVLYSISMVFTILLILLTIITKLKSVFNVLQYKFSFIDCLMQDALGLFFNILVSRGFND